MNQGNRACYFVVFCYNLNRSENLQGLLRPLSSSVGSLPSKPMLGVGSVAATPCSKILQVTPSEGVLN
jgi:hypothetical protein